MPKIDAPTVAEHRAKVRARLVDAAETVLRTDPTHLTAGAVTGAAGIARNSIYRYVDSVDDLRTMVIDRYLPDWLAAVATAVTTATSPEERIVTWVRANLEQASATGHGWLMEAARRAPSRSMDEAATLAHTGMRTSLTDAWGEVLGSDPDRVAIATDLTVGILDAGFRQLDQGLDVTLVIGTVVDATRAVVRSLER